MMPAVFSLRRSSCALALLAAALLPLAAGGCGGNGDGDGDARPSGSPTDDGVVATVDGSRVLADEVQLVLAERKFTGEDEASSPALDEAIERTLMRREAERLGVRADEAVVTQRLDELESTYGGAAALDAALGRVGLGRTQLRRSVTDGVLRESLRDAKFSRTRATPRDVSSFYRRNLRRLFTNPASVHLGAIQVRTERVAENALGLLREGRPFSQVAGQLSMDPESRDNGGDLGWVMTSSLPPALRKAVVASKRGVIMKPVGGGNAWYVLNVLGRRPERVTPLERIRSRLAAELTRVERSKALERWLDEAREGATVVLP
jgi:parvulin-like peptidyl-prolyl isomerase